MLEHPPTLDGPAISVVIPTIGRPALLPALLDSIAACDPAPAEVLIVDQSPGEEVSRIAADYERVRVHACTGRGEALARNTGLREAANDIVLWTDDDCTVAPDWVGAATARMRDPVPGLVTGRVLPGNGGRIGGVAGGVPSTKDDPRPHEFTGEISSGALYPPCMVFDRQEALELGGFDERLPTATDNDFAYRWLRSGRRLRYEPDMVVWHHDWRSPAELRTQYERYARGQGIFYAKHLRERDLNMVRFVARDSVTALVGLGQLALRGRKGWSNYRRGLLVALYPGILEGLRVFSASRDGR
jgi:GT2 family glycosyltransferase